MKSALSLLIICVCLYLVACALLYFFQRNLLYYPTSKYNHPFTEIQYENEGESLSSIVLNQDNEDALIYFGGNGEAVVANASEFTEAFSAKTVYLVNYRGYGGSGGVPTERGIFSDALALYDELKTKHKLISVAGRSLGSGVATYLAANRPVDKIILITPYDSIENVAKANYGIFPVGLLLKDKYNSISRVKDIASQVLVIAADNDRVIPMRHTDALVNEINKDLVQFEIIKNSGHNDISDSDLYYELMRDFL